MQVRGKGIKPDKRTKAGKQGHIEKKLKLCGVGERWECGMEMLRL